MINNYQEIANKIAVDFNPDKIVLFGSYAYGNARVDSDIDLLVIMPFEGSSFSKSLEILNRLDLHIPIDLIAKRPEEVKRRYLEYDPFIREAIDKGKVLYERNS